MARKLNISELKWLILIEASRKKQKKRKTSSYVNEVTIEPQDQSDDQIIGAFQDEQLRFYDNNPDAFKDGTTRESWEQQVRNASEALYDYLETLVMDLHNGEYAI